MDKTSQHHGVSSPLKAVALAVLLAMSPLNNNNSFALSNPETVEMTQNTKRTTGIPYTPKPAHFRILGVDTHKENYNKKLGLTEIYEFKLISTDNDDSDYELLEYVWTTKYDGHPESTADRGLICGVEFEIEKDGKKRVNVGGIKLDDNDLKNYAPQRGIFYTTFFGDEYWNLFKEALTLEENSAVMEIKESKYRSYYDFDLELYNRRLIRPNL